MNTFFVHSFYQVFFEFLDEIAALKQTNAVYSKFDQH